MRSDLKTELLSETEPEFKDLENSQPIHIVKNKEVQLEKNTKGVAKRV